MTDPTWFEDFTPGTVLHSGPRRITLDDIDRYADLTGRASPGPHGRGIRARGRAFAGASRTACSRSRWSRG